MAITAGDIRYPLLTRKWRKYYKIDEVDHHLEQMTAASEKERREYIALSAKYEALLREETAHHERAAAQEQQISRQAKELEEKTLEMDQLRNQLVNSRVESARQSEEYAQLTIELARYQTRIEKLNELISKLESQNPDDLVLEAENKAEQIVTKAVTDSEKMLQQINEQRARIVAASRAAYYNALQFKQELAERFRRMEQELDSSIDILRILENSRLSLLQMADSPQVIQERGSMKP